MKLKIFGFKLKNILKNMDKNILIVSSAGVSG